MKNASIVALITVSILFAAGCSSSQQVKTQVFGEVPSWFLKPDEGGRTEEIYGVGSYRAGDLGYARMQAVNNARADLSSSLRIKVDAAVKNTMSDVAKVAPDADLSPVSQVGDAFRQSLSSEALGGATVKDAVVSDNGTLYVRVAVSKDSVEKTLEQTFSQAVITQMRSHATEVEASFRRQLDQLPWNAR